MKKQIRWPALGATLALLHTTSAARAGDVTVELLGVEPRRGPVRVAAFATAEDWAADRRASSVEIQASGDRVSAVLADLPPGRYGIAAYQDTDGDGALSKSFLGIPKEPYGFANAARGALGPPPFEAITVQVPETPISIRIGLE